MTKLLFTLCCFILFMLIASLLGKDIVTLFVWAVVSDVMLIAYFQSRKGLPDKGRQTVRALPAPAAPTLAVQDGFALLEERFQEIVQVRARRFEQGTLALPEWKERYQALLQARQELETPALREAVLRLDEYRLAVRGRRLQQRYERKLQALCDETMEALLQRADALMDQAFGK